MSHKIIDEVLSGGLFVVFEIVNFLCLNFLPATMDRSAQFSLECQSSHISPSSHAMKPSAVSAILDCRPTEPLSENKQSTDNLGQESGEERIFSRPPDDLSPQPAKPPDGGYMAWMQVAGSWCLMFNCW